MASLSRKRFVRLLRRLSDDGFAAFVADLWRERGWDATVEGRVVVVRRDEPAERRVLAVRHDARRLGRPDPVERGDVTDVVTSARGSRRARKAANGRDARLVDADELYDRVRYGLDREAAERLFQRHVGRSMVATSPGTIREWLAAVRERARPLHGGIVVALAAIVLAGMIAGGGVGPVAFPGEGAAEPPGTPAPIATFTPTSTGTPTATATPTVSAPSEPWIGAGEDAWRMFRGGPANTGWRPGVAAPDEGRILATFEIGGPIFSSPAVVDGVVYVGATIRIGVGRTSGALFALDAATLAPRWSRPIGHAVTTSPAVVNGTVYVGALSWRPTGSRGRFEAFVNVHAVDATRPRQGWVTRAGSAIVINPQPVIVSSPTVANGTVYVGGAVGRVYALDARSGDPRWTTTVNGTAFASPAVVNGTVYVGSSDDTVYALAAGTGSIRWATGVNGAVFASPAVANGTVYVGSEGGTVYAMHAGNGSIRWTVPTDARIVSSPAVANGTVYVGSGDGTVYALDATDGSVEWTAAAGDGIVSSPAVADGTVYLGSFDGGVYALDAATGEERWVVTTNGSVLSSPAVANGVVYIGSNDGTVYAIGEPTRNAASGDRRRQQSFTRLRAVLASRGMLDDRDAFNRSG